MSKRKGKGWHGQPDRHSLAAKGVPTAANMRRAQKIRDMLSSEESLHESVEGYMETAIEWMEGATYDTPVSKSELKEAYNEVDKLLGKAARYETSAQRRMELYSLQVEVGKARRTLGGKQ